MASGNLIFDGTGHLATPAAAAGSIPIPIKGLSNGAADVSVNWNLYDSTGTATLTDFNQASANLGSTQDGTASGQLNQIAIGSQRTDSGPVFEWRRDPVAATGAGNGLNPDSMSDLGNNTFGVTSSTSLPAIGLPGTGSRGKISGGALESSTVDIAKEFTDLLTYERGYQANSKVVTTEDEVTQATINLSNSSSQNADHDPASRKSLTSPICRSTSKSSSTGARMKLSEILALEEGSIIEMRRSAGENIDIYIGSDWWHSAKS